SRRRPGRGNPTRSGDHLRPRGRTPRSDRTTPSRCRTGRPGRAPAAGAGSRLLRTPAAGRRAIRRRRWPRRRPGRGGPVRRPARRPRGSTTVTATQFVGTLRVLLSVTGPEHRGVQRGGVSFGGGEALLGALPQFVDLFLDAHQFLAAAAVAVGMALG